MKTYDEEELGSIIELYLSQRKEGTVIDIRKNQFIDVQITSSDTLIVDYPELAQLSLSSYIFINLDESIESDKHLLLFSQQYEAELPIIIKAVNDGIHTYIIEYSQNNLQKVMRSIFNYGADAKFFVDASFGNINHGNN